MNSLDLVREFHAAFGQDDAAAPRIGNDGINELRLKLIREETDELALALAEGDAVDVLDALTDLQYVLDGAYLQLGFAAVKDRALVEVHRSNMSKIGEDGRPVHRDDGKILKGPNYSPPNLRPMLDPVEHGLDELRDAPALDLRLKAEPTGGVA